MFSLQNYIGGQLQPADSKQWLDNSDPSTGQVYSQIPDSSEADVHQAVKAAKQAFPAWSAMPSEQRADILMEIARRIDEQADELAHAESVDNGKPKSLASMVDIPRSSSNIRFFAHAITQFASESHSMGDIAINYTLRDPVGIVGCISPWNLPLYLFTWKIAPAMAAGNCVIAKPSEVTPVTAWLFSKICKEAGLPDGVLNIIHGAGPSVGNAIVSHPDIKAISFTGGTKTGAHIASVTAPMFKKVSLELGGKNPTLIFADCDFDKTLDEVIRATFANQGQICLCGSRIYIERPLYEKFKAAFVDRVKRLKPGDPLLPETSQGAVVSKQHMEKILSYIELAKEEGATILAGGHAVTVPGRCEQGYFIQPTILEGLDICHRTNQEEIFGPVVTLQPFDTDEEALMLANGTDYGLATSVWSQNISRCHLLAKQLNFGIVWINCWLLRDLRTPFGGMKQSGVGREGGLEALRFFTEPKNVCIKY